MDLYQLARPLLFQLNPETAHDATLQMAKRFPFTATTWGAPSAMNLSCLVGKVRWRSPIGLAAGLDKNAWALEFFHRLGFGSMECGTVTPLPQVGNPRPRIERFPTELSLRNSMGFPNLGAEQLALRLERRPQGFPVGINIGKSKLASPTEAISEYAQLYDQLAPLGDWVVVNISSPNTPGLRDLQQESWLTDLFGELAPLKQKHGKEIHVKLAPDMDDEQLRALTSVLADLGVDGLVATNTTHMPERGPGGVSGRLLRVKAHQKRRVVLKIARDRGLPMVGVGGFEDMNDVYAYWASGGGAFQIYTSFVYQGPVILRHFERGIERFLERAGLSRLEDFLALELPERQRLIAQFGEKS